VALTTLAQILANALAPMETRGRIIGALRDPAPSNPLSAADLALANAAIDSTQGRAATDVLDAAILAGVLAQLDRCILHASANSSRIEPAALFGAGMWINASGPPTDLLRWLAGDAVELSGEPVPVLARGATVDQAAWLTYYERIPFVLKFPNQLPAMLDAIAVGVTELGSGSAVCKQPLHTQPAGAAPVVAGNATTDDPATLSNLRTVAPDDPADALNAAELQSVESAA
jgi:hypothetical protein